MKDWSPAELFTEGRSGKWVGDDGVTHFHGDCAPDPAPVTIVTFGPYNVCTPAWPSLGRRILADWAMSEDEISLAEAWCAKGEVVPVYRNDDPRLTPALVKLF